MIPFAKVSLAAVVSFIEGVKTAVDYKDDLEAGAVCLTNFSEWLSEGIHDINPYISRLESAMSHVKEVISQIEAEIQDIETKRSDLSDQLDEIQGSLNELEDMSEAASPDDPAEDGELSDYQIQESQLTLALSTLDLDLCEKQNRLATAEDVLKRLEEKQDLASEYISSLEQMLQNSRQAEEEFDQIKKSNLVRGEHAIAKLSAIRHIIEQYTAIEFKCDTTFFNDENNKITIEQSINDNRKYAKDASEKIKTTHEDVKQTKQVVELGDDKKQGGELQKNSTFRKDGFVFQTDNEGRPKSASGKISISDRPRNVKEALSIIAKGDERDTDERGHLIGHQLNGPDELGNLIAQDQTINKGEYKKLENYLRKQLEEGRKVFVSVSPIYDQQSNRPEIIFYFFSIDGVGHCRWFPNVYSEVSK